MIGSACHGSTGSVILSLSLSPAPRPLGRSSSPRLRRHVNRLRAGGRTGSGRDVTGATEGRTVFVSAYPVEFELIMSKQVEQAA